MKVGERGQVTIPIHIRQKFGIDANSQVEFQEVDGKIVLKKVPVKIGIRKWRGKCGGTFAKQGYSSVDKFMDDIRGKR
jgi:AbrB family looped-hinge helix DNA binding protein